MLLLLQIFYSFLLLASCKKFKVKIGNCDSPSIQNDDSVLEVGEKLIKSLIIFNSSKTYDKNEIQKTSFIYKEATLLTNTTIFNESFAVFFSKESTFILDNKVATFLIKVSRDDMVEIEGLQNKSNLSFKIIHSEDYYYEKSFKFAIFAIGFSILQIIIYKFLVFIYKVLNELRVNTMIKKLPELTIIISFFSLYPSSEGLMPCGIEILFVIFYTGYKTLLLVCIIKISTGWMVIRFQNDSAKITYLAAGIFFIEIIIEITLRLILGKPNTFGLGIFPILEIKNVAEFLFILFYVSCASTSLIKKLLKQKRLEERMNIETAPIYSKKASKMTLFLIFSSTYCLTKILFPIICWGCSSIQFFQEDEGACYWKHFILLFDSIFNAFFIGLFIPKRRSDDDLYNIVFTYNTSVYFANLNEGAYEIPKAKNLLLKAEEDKLPIIVLSPYGSEKSFYNEKSMSMVGFPENYNEGLFDFTLFDNL